MEEHLAKAKTPGEALLLAVKNALPDAPLGTWESLSEEDRTALEAAADDLDEWMQENEEYDDDSESEFY